MFSRKNKGMLPKYNLDKIKFATDTATFEKAADIYDSGGIRNFKGDGFGFEATVCGSKGNIYNVRVSAKEYDRGTCSCYLGEQDILCKHMVAVALCAAKGGKPLTQDDKKITRGPAASGKRGALNAAELKEVKAEVAAALRYIKPYNGPSRIWFQYQNSLSEGCNRLSKIVSDLPIGEQTAKLLVNVLLRLDDKLCRGGVDDSDGTVGGFIEETVQVLKEYVKLNPLCAKAFSELKGKKTCFGWEEPLLAAL